MYAVRGEQFHKPDDVCRGEVNTRVGVAEATQWLATHVANAGASRVRFGLRKKAVQAPRVVLFGDRPERSL